MQFGFRRGRSTVDAVNRVAEKIGSVFEDGESLALTLCDLSRAFDCVDHHILIKKLRYYGVMDSALDILESYLTGRTQVVSLSGAVSCPLPVRFGVPQGSILGPILFIVMINDLDDNGATLLFADDTSLLSSGIDLQQVLERSAEHLRSSTSWFLVNRFQLNESKTQNIVCSLSRNLPHDQEPVKLLGFMLDSKLSWASHIQQVTKRLSRICFLLLKLRGHVTEAYLVMVYHALFHCHISYGLLMWGHSAKVVDILKLQKRAARIITGSEHLAHCKPIFARLGILTVISHFLLLCLMYMKKNQQNLLTRTDVHHHNTRHRELFDVPRVRLQRSRVCYRSSALRYFNRLPAGVKQLDLSMFERVVTGFLRTRAYYDVQEYMNDDLSQILSG